MWREKLAGYPDPAFSNYILKGISEGFRIGYSYGTKPLRSLSRNLLSAEQYPSVVDEYLSAELAQGRIVEFSEEVKNIHFSPFGVIPKKNKPGKWRLIVDLSAPEGSSVNDAISREWCSLSYVSIDDVVECILQKGRGAMLAKMDIKQAYRNIPVHPEDRALLGMKWQGRAFADKVLPFGLQSAPIIFTAFADDLQWLIQKQGVESIFHYLDNFITVGKPGSPECEINMKIMEQMCKDTGTPVEEDKCEGQATTIRFLGIELDTVAMEMRLPEDKLQQLRKQVHDWRGKKAVSKRELLSLIGSLQHACKAVRPGRSFMRRLIDLSKRATRLDHHLRLNLSARSDIQWWHRFAAEWNGTSMFMQVKRDVPDVVVTSDTSGSWGCGAFSGSQWFQLQWNSALEGSHITLKELVPIVLAAGIWGKQWIGKTVLAQCDNAAVVAIVNSGSSKDAEVMHLMRCLAFVAAKFNFVVVSSHIKGADNELADALSRDRAHFFLSHCPQAQPHPSVILLELLDLVGVEKPDWTSRNWTSLWSSTFGMH